MGTQNAIAIDPITFEVVRNRMESILREMETVTVRSARSSVVHSGRDFSCALLTSTPELLVFGGSLVHIATMTWQMKHIHENYENDVLDGDVFLGNDPYEGGNHLNDVLMVVPIVAHRSIAGWVANRIHHFDVGGMVPGSISGNAREIFQEGIRIPMVRIGREYDIDSDVLRLVLRNVRIPGEMRGDIAAQLASCRIGVTRVKQAFTKYGLDQVSAIWSQLLSASEQGMRRRIAALPNATVSHEAYLDNDGVIPEPRRIHAAVTVRSGELIVDYSGTSPASAGPLNITEGLANGYALIGVKAALDPAGPFNGGLFRCLRVIAPSGSMVNADPPHAAAGTAEVGQAAIAVMVALSKLTPDSVSAEDSASGNHVNLGGKASNGRPFVYYDYLAKGGGARLGMDGVDCTRDIRLGNTNMQSLEILEQQFPVRFIRFSLRRDSGGAGRFRGGLGIEREVEIDVDARLSILGEHALMPIAGYDYGCPGALARWTIGRGTHRRPVSKVYGSKATAVPIKRGDRLRMLTQGGGGWGDPLTRDPNAVLSDVLDGKVSVRAAHEQYGVTVVGRHVDGDETNRVRRKLRKSRHCLAAVRGGDPTWDRGLRVAWVSESTLPATGARANSIAELFAATRPNPIRVRLRTRSSVPRMAVALDDEAWNELCLAESADIRLRPICLDRVATAPCSGAAVG